MGFLTIQKRIIIIGLLIGFAGICSAQLENDRCENATVMLLGASYSDCSPITGTTIGAEDARTIEGPIVCSANWYSDDVWFQFSTNDNPPSNGIIIESIYSGINGEVPELGMAVYDGCDPTDEPYDCFSDSPGRRTLEILASCILPNTTYYVRCWSTGDTELDAPNLNAGSFSICAYASPPLEPSNDVVIWSEDFANGPGGFVSIPLPNSTGDCIHDWVWDKNGTFLNYGSQGPGTINLASAACNGAMGFRASYYQTGCSGLAADIPKDPKNYIDFGAQLNSPPIDLSNNASVSVKWKESFQGLSTATNSTLGAYFEYSIDGGVEWFGIDLNKNDVRAKNYIRKREFTLFGAGGQADVRLRFTFEGNGFMWIIDNIQIIEGPSNDLSIQNDFYAIAPTSTMPVSQLDDVRFLIDIFNNSDETQTNTTVNCTCIDDNSGAIVFNEDLAYGSLEGGTLADKKEFEGRLKPPAGIVTTYTCTYTVSADAPDDNLSNNTQSFTFEVTDEEQFRKEAGRTRGITPLASAFWDPDEPHCWEIGNVFYASEETSPDGFSMYFTSIDFQIDNPSDLADEEVVAWVYEITDIDFNGVIDKTNQSEIKRLAVGIYKFTGNESPEDIISVDLQKWNQPQDMFIKANTHYFASIEFVTKTLGIDMIVAASQEFDYSAAMYVTRSQTDPGITPPKSGNDIRYSNGRGICKEEILRFHPSNESTTLNLGDDLVPVIRLNYREEVIDIINSNNDLAENIEIEIFPTLASIEINLNIEMTELSKNLNVQIVDIRGNLVLSRDYDKVQTMKEVYNISQLSDGIYFMHVSSEQGIQTKRFVVAK